MAFSCSETTGVEPRKWERCWQAKESCINYTAVVKISWKLILFVFCSVFLSSQASAVITPGTFSFLSWFFSIQAQGHAAELQVNQAAVWDFKCNRSHVFLYMSALELLFEWICKQYNTMAECSDKTEKKYFQNILVHEKKRLNVLTCPGSWLKQPEKSCPSPEDGNSIFWGAQGIIPHSQDAGWTRAAFLAHCSPVALWDEHMLIRAQIGTPVVHSQMHSWLIKSPLHLSDTRWTVP